MTHKEMVEVLSPKGAGSPYLLFYRKKGLNPPTPVLSRVSSPVPAEETGEHGRQPGESSPEPPNISLIE